MLVNRGLQPQKAQIDALYAVEMFSTCEYDSQDDTGIHLTVPPESAFLLRCFGAP